MSVPPKIFTASESGAFVEQLRLEPTGSGSLDGLTFAVKDLIDIKGHVSGCGRHACGRHGPCGGDEAVRMPLALPVSAGLTAFYHSHISFRAFLGQGGILIMRRNAPLGN